MVCLQRSGRSWALLQYVFSVKQRDGHRSYLFFPSHCSEQTTILEILDDGVCDSVEHGPDILCVCGTGHVGVDLFLALLHVQILELHLDVVASIIVCVLPYWWNKSVGLKFMPQFFSPFPLLYVPK